MTFWQAVLAALRGRPERQGAPEVGIPTSPPPPLVPVSLLRAQFPSGRELEAFSAVLSRECPRYGVTTPARLAAWLAQTGHETAGYRVWVENLNYGASALRATWPKRFPDGIADAYARQPERIANRAYADRMGNGPESSGDGWRYRGRGLIQITGRDNYAQCAAALGRPLADLPAWLETPEGAAVASLWWWRQHGCNELADLGGVEALTKRINGGTHGLDDRRARLVLANQLLEV